MRAWYDGGDRHASAHGSPPSKPTATAQQCGSCLGPSPPRLEACVRCRPPPTTHSTPLSLSCGGTGQRLRPPLKAGIHASVRGYKDAREPAYRILNSSSTHSLINHSSPSFETLSSCIAWCNYLFTFLFQQLLYCHSFYRISSLIEPIPHSFLNTPSLISSTEDALPRSLHSRRWPCHSR